MWSCFLRGIRLTTRFGITPCARPEKRPSLPGTDGLLQRKFRAIYSQTHSPALLALQGAGMHSVLKAALFAALPLLRDALRAFLEESWAAI